MKISEKVLYYTASEYIIYTHMHNDVQPNERMPFHTASKYGSKRYHMG